MFCESSSGPGIKQPLDPEAEAEGIAANELCNLASLLYIPFVRRRVKTVTHYRDGHLLHGHIHPVHGSCHLPTCRQMTHALPLPPDHCRRRTINFDSNLIVA
jgi:hypothetical protein